MTRSLDVGVILTFGVWLCIAPSAVASGQTIKRQFGQTTVALSTTGPAEDLTVHVRVAGPQVSREFAAHTVAEHVTDIALFQDQTLMVLGRSGPAHSVTVINVADGSVRDAFLCLFPVASPDGRFVAYRQFYLSVVVNPGAVYLAYGVSLSADQNRMAGTVRSGPFRFSTEAGVPLYPPENRALRSYDVSLLPEEQRHTEMESSIVWTTNDSFVFGDRTRNALRAVLVQMPTGLRSATIPNSSLTLAL
jgi:hypothetical protein